MTNFRQKNVLVTGGANGLGKLLAQRSLEKGAQCVVIWDINEANLHKTVDELNAKGFEVYGQIVDVSNVNDIEKAAAKTLSEVGTIDILFNNAGIVAGNKPFYEHTKRDIEKTIGINVLGVMHVARVFMQGMVEKRRGHVINIASAAGLMANPKMSVYAASKWAVLGWSESLRIELEAVSSNMHVTTVTPSYINTGMFEGVTAPLLTPILDPEEVADEIIKAVRDNEPLLRMPLSVHLIPILKGILPLRVFDFVADNIFGVYKTMDNFIGRPKEEAVPDKKKARTNGTTA